jgi:septal ring factor EnvC (AmiA/AmiB activator)
MSNQVKWVVGVALAALLFAGGYVLGERKVGPLEEQIDAMRLKAADADTVRKNSQATMDKALKTQADENAKQLEAVKSDAERSRKELAAQLAAANDRNAELEKQSKKAKAPRKAKGRAQVAEVARCTEVLRGQLDPAACLALAVPRQNIVPLIK